MNKKRLILSSAYAAIAAIIFAVVITIWAELSPQLKDWLKGFSGHHWTSKSIFSVLLYSIITATLYGVLGKPSDDGLRKALNILFVSLILGVIIIFAFYTGHYFKFF